MFKKGEPRPIGAGRKKGTPHKKNLLVREVLESHGINLAEQILLRLQQVSKEEQLKTLVQMLPYVYPRLTSTQLSGSVEGIEVVIRDYTSKK